MPLGRPVPSAASYPRTRLRRPRAAAWSRDLVRENALSASDLIWPLFVIDGTNRAEPIGSMPGVFRLSVDRLAAEAERAARLGVPCVALFPYVDPSLKTATCEEAWREDNLVCQATRAVKAAVPDIGVMLDVALDPYNAYGHDGLIRGGRILNDETVQALVKQSLAQAAAGADVLGPSDMMDGRVGAMRDALEGAGFENTLILSYAAKFASSFYGPFRDAVGAGGALASADAVDAPKDKKTYQLDPGNIDEALRECALDVAEGADMLMVKPGLPFLDVCARVKDAFGLPTFAYQVSGEFAMIEAAAANGWLDRRSAILESLIAFKRAGCDGVLTYFAAEVAEWISQGAA